MKLGQLFLDEGISLESALNFVNDGLVMINSEARILFFNEAAKRITGLYPEGHYTFWPSYIGVFQDDKGTIYDPHNLPIIRALHGETITDETVYIQNDLIENLICVSCNASPILNEGKIVGAILTFRDISERLRKEAEVRKERESFHKILNSIPAYVFTNDLGGNYTFLNDRFQNDFEATFGSKPSREMITEDLAWKVANRDLMVISTKKPIEFEEEYPNKVTGKMIYFRTTRIPLIDNKNEVYGICGISYDVTVERERKKSLEEERTKIATASKLAALGMLAAEMGHEINNPLAIIRTSSWIMRKVLSGDLPDVTTALLKLDEIDETVQRISDIVTSLKNISRDSSKEEMNRFLLKDILRDVQSLCLPKFHPKGIAYRLNVSPELLTETFSCYRVQLSEVLINLIVNAVDATETCQNPWIELKVFKDNDVLIFQISDSGPGVPPDLERKIFAPFFSTKELGKGTGLGLSISKDIMKRHGGDLILNRKISDNCFEATLPLK